MKDGHAVFTIFLAFIFWCITFNLRIVNFWLAMSLAVVVLTFLAVFWGGTPFAKKDLSLRAVLVGIGSALFLYGIFYLGNSVATFVFSFASEQISAVYDFSSQGTAWAIFIVLFFITSPGEEIFWRGFLQGWAMERYGKYRGLVISALLYAGVHIVSGNFMLVMASLVAGFFWGYIYLKERNIIALIVSHSLWTVGIFVLFPVV